MGPNKHKKFTYLEKLVMMASFQENQLQPFLVFFNFILNLWPGPTYRSNLIKPNTTSSHAKYS